MVNNPHKDHRKRLRNELIEQDFHDSIPDHKVLETLLFYGIPQKDTNALAHDLINIFGSLPEVFEADADSLFQVKGMTEKSVCLIKMMLPLFRRYYSQRVIINKEFKSIEHICDELVKKHMGFGREVCLLTTLNASGNLIAYDVLAKGTETNVSFVSKDVVQKALKHEASFIIISHNHLSGSVVPSADDIESTARLSYTLREIGIRLLDHVVISGSEYFSMAKNKCLDPTN